MKPCTVEHLNFTR